jgi:2-amino-4-hydroxy-6-hydroxymethyldihydropteridine diphosphokinase
MAAALIALGSNLGERQRILDDAIAQLAAQPGIRVVAKSRWHATRPVGGPPGQGEFLNGAALVETSLSPEHLLARLKQIESAAGRNRAERWAPRTLDLDLLLYDELVIETAELTVPHPRMAFRRFVLEPAAEVTRAMRHPTIGWTIEELRDHLRARTPYVAAITGLAAADKSALANAAAKALVGRVIADPEPFDFNFGAICFRRRSFESAIQLLERRAEPIRMTSWVSTAFMAISDFWFHEAWFLAASCSDRCGEYVERILELAGSISQPKLLAIVESATTDSWSLEAITRSILGSASRRGTLGPPTALNSLVEVHWRGPLLRLDATKPHEARDELIAAIQAMQ